jgi:hypothetical protein
MRNLWLCDALRRRVSTTIKAVEMQMTTAVRIGDCINYRFIFNLAKLDTHALHALCGSELSSHIVHASLSYSAASASAETSASLATPKRSKLGSASKAHRVCPRLVIPASAFSPRHRFGRILLAGNSALTMSEKSQARVSVVPCYVWQRNAGSHANLL